MKFLQLIAFSLLSFSVFAQNSINYISPDFAQEDNYFGTKNHFIYDEERGIRLNSSSQFASELKSYISTECQSIDDAQWELSVKINATTSSGNFVRYYIVSDNSNLSVSLNGYFVMIGNTNDEICLYKQSGATKTKIIDGTDARVATSTVNVSVKVTRSKDGKWTLYSKLASESDYVEEGNCIENTYTESKYCGVYMEYSLSNNTKYSFNDWIVSGEKAQPKYQPKFGDIAFNELMVKPSPAVALPEEEYIEIINLTSETIDLNGVYLCDASKKYAFPQGSSLAPNSITLFCTQKNADKFADFGNTIALASLPALTDSGKLLWIEDGEGRTICWVEYDEKWYSDAFKANGGWAIECIDPSNKSNTPDNWNFANSKQGGTPAQENSIAGTNADKQKPKLTKTTVIDNNSVQLLFDETMNSEKLTNPASYSIPNGELNITQAEPLLPKCNGVVLHFDRELTNEILEMQIEVTDFAGNALQNPNTFIAKIPEIDTDDFVINEFLIGQKGESVNFVEFYNRSEHLLDISDLYLCSRKDGALTAGSLLANEQTLVTPESYIVVTTDTAQLKKLYLCGEENALFVEIKSLSEFTVNGGAIVIVRRNTDIVNEVGYTAEMCTRMTAKNDIASIERDDFAQNEWHASTEKATPGRQNSERASEDNEPEEYSDDDTGDDTPMMKIGVALQEKSFSPNGDGYRDMLNINCRLKEESGYIKIDIYTAQGAIVRHLVGKTAISEPTVFNWDGTDNDGKVCNIGLYLVYVETQTTQQGIKRYKLPFAITKD